MKKVKGPDDEFWARVNAKERCKMERRVIGDAAWDDEDGDCPGCEKCEDWVRGQRGEGATLKE